jgi:uncharacterized protein YerC
MDNNQIIHSGILGQKWGQRNGPPYPLKPSAHSSAEKKAMKSSGSRGASVAKYKAKIAKKAQIKEADNAAKKKKNEEQKAAQNEKLKAKVLKSRSIAKVYKHADLFSDQELEQLKNRFILENDIKKLKNSTYTQKGRDFVDKIGVAGDTLGKVANIIENGSRTYNNVAKVMNSLYGSDMKIIGDKDKKNSNKRETEYTTTTKTKDKSGNDVTIVKKWKE